jgi:hypothetical protein
MMNPEAVSAVMLADGQWYYVHKGSLNINSETTNVQFLTFNSKRVADILISTSLDEIKTFAMGGVPAPVGSTPVVLVG